MGIIIGLIVTFGCVLGGYMAMGGYVKVLWQPFEVVIIVGAAIGIFLVANTMSAIKDSGKAMMEALTNKVPSNDDYLELLGLLHRLMRELKSKPRNEVEGHIDNPEESDIFAEYPLVLAREDLTNFICDYVRLIIVGNARPHEVEALMEEEIATIKGDKLKPYQALQNSADGLPAIGIVAAILGVIMEHFTAGRPVLIEQEDAAGAEEEDDDEVVLQIKELLDTRVRPAVAQDGGDIIFHGFEEGIVYLAMQGACSGCPSSTATLKMGIENMLRHYIPEVVEVRAVM